MRYSSGATTPTVLDMSVHVVSKECLLTYVTDLGYKKKMHIISDPADSSHNQRGSIVDN